MPDSTEHLMKESAKVSPPPKKNVTTKGGIVCPPLFFHKKIIVIIYFYDSIIGFKTFFRRYLKKKLMSIFYLVRHCFHCWPTVSMFLFMGHLSIFIHDIVELQNYFSDTVVLTNSTLRVKNVAWQQKAGFS